MKLKEYFEKERIDPVTFSLKAGIGLTTVYRYLRGSIPSFRNAIKIEKATKGKVTLEEQRPNNEIEGK